MQSKKTPLVLVPGLLCDGRLFGPQLEGLKNVAEARIAPVTGGDSVRALARNLLEQAPPRFALAGLSMGGYISLEVMRQAPKRVTALALLDTSARPDTPEQTQARLELVKLARESGLDEVVHNLLPRLLHPKNRSDGTLVSKVLGMARSVGVEGFAEQERAIIGRPDSRPNLPNIGCPALVLCGGEDEITPPDLHQELADAIPKADLRVLDGCAHLSTLERPEEVNSSLREWLARAKV